VAYSLPETDQSVFPEEQQNLLSPDMERSCRDYIPRTGLYPMAKIVEPYPRIDVIDFVSVEDGAQLEQTA
jgi:hypothetical protein